MTPDGTHGVPQDILKQFGLENENTNRGALYEYVFDASGLLRTITIPATGTTHTVNGLPAHFTVDESVIPGEFPCFTVTAVGTSGQHPICSQNGKFVNGNTVLFLSFDNGSINPLSTGQGAEFEVQKWSSGKAWWSEAFTFCNGAVATYAKTVQP